MKSVKFYGYETIKDFRFNDGLDVGDRAHVVLYTDIEPCTVIKRTEKTVTVRYDDADLDPEWKPEIIVGGFSGHCVNDDTQKWIIREDPNGRVERFRLTKNGWMHEGCKLRKGWFKYYDYNF